MSMALISQYLLSALAALIVLTVHEYSHGYVAYRLGDPTAKSLGRLSLNPLCHLDPIGVVCMVLFHFGWARPVPINPRYFKKPKRDFALTALAGPLSNLLMAFFTTFFYLLTYHFVKDIAFTSRILFNAISYTLLFLELFILINIGIAIFNLIPIPPLDGSRLLNVILPPRIYFGIMRHERKIYFGLLIWLFAGSVLSNLLLSIPILSDIAPIRVLCEILSLSGLLGKLSSLIYSGFMKFWQLIPFLKL